MTGNGGFKIPFPVLYMIHNDRDWKIQYFAGG